MPRPVHTNAMLMRALMPAEGSSVHAADADLPFGAGWATGLTVYGASAQLAAIDVTAGYP